MNRTTRDPRATLIRGGAALAVALAGAALAAPAATADTTDAPTAEGWVRLAHLSPDTPEVDIQLTNVATAETEEYNGVGYADVSDYERLQPGSYVVAMLPAGAPEGTDPVITQAVEVVEGEAYTVAAVGLNADLSGRVITDDLQSPEEGTARVRLIQASVSEPVVDVVTDTGAAIATEAEFASVTGYAEVDAGGWTLEVSGEDSSGVVQVDLAPGSNNTLFAIDRDGELTIAAIEDSSGAQTMPQGGVATGGGGLYHAEQRQRTLVAAAGVALIGAIGAAVVLRRRSATDGGPA